MVSVSLRRAVAVALLPLSVAGVLASAAPAEAATTTVQGERMTVKAGRTAIISDPLAFADRARVIRSDGRLAATVTTPALQRIDLCLRGRQYLGAPRAVVRVDGVRVASLRVTATRWTTYRVAGRWAAGRHRVTISYPNDRGRRALLVDRVTLVPVASAGSTAATTALNDSYEARIVTLVNTERAKAGLRPLAVSSCADRFAEDWSARMATTGSFAHRPDLGVLLSSCSASAVGENIVYGNVSADEMMRMWMNSPGHRANILTARFTHIGVGAARTASGRVYGTQNFLTI